MAGISGGVSLQSGGKILVLWGVLLTLLRIHGQVADGRICDSMIQPTRKNVTEMLLTRWM